MRGRDVVRNAFWVENQQTQSGEEHREKWRGISGRETPINDEEAKDIWSEDCILPLFYANR